MTRQKSPHTQSGQNTRPERTDLETDQGDVDPEDKMYENVAGAETGTNRSPRRGQKGARRHRIEPERAAHEGSVSSRVPKKPAQGVSSRSAEEEGRGQKKVVRDRLDARAGANRSK